MFPKRCHIKSLLLGVSLALLGPAPTALGLQTDAKQAINIEADQMTLDEAGGIATYLGNVRFAQGSIVIRADRLTLRRHDGRIASMLMTGKTRAATFEQLTESGQLARGQAMRIEYDAQQSRLVLTGTAELAQGDNHIRSSRIDYNTQTNNLTAGHADAGNSAAPGSNNPQTASERVRIIITPQ